MSDNGLNLKEALLAEYGSFADKRITKIKTGSVFVVDDRKERDLGADKKLYSYFCMMFAEVIGNREVRLSLSGNVPSGTTVSTCLLEAGYATSTEKLTIKVTPSSLHFLPKLAEALRAIVAPGASYDVANYKYVCPRTANSLDRIASTLAKHWQTPVLA